MSGDIELNPGPASNASVVSRLTKALAELVGQAPTGDVKDVIATWAPEKPNIATDMNKFKVSVLKETLAWLWNKDNNDKVINKKNKSELNECIIIAIEVLLPDT